MEVRRQVEPGAVEADQALDRQVQLADQHALGPDGLAHPRHHLQHLGPVGRVLGDQRVVGVPALAPGRIGRVVAPLVVLDQLAQGVDAEAVGAAVAPEAQDVELGLLHGRVAPVEIGLLGQVGVVVPGAAALVPGPGGAAEHAHPVRRRAVGRAVAPQVALGMLAPPGMLDRRVVGHEVEDQPQPELVGIGGERVPVLQRAEQRVDVAVVGDVVAEVGHRRAVERRQPERVDAQPGQVGEPAAQAGQVADPVAVAVLERAGIDLVDRPAAPPAHE